MACGFRYSVIKALPCFSAFLLAPPSPVWGFFSGRVPLWSEEAQ